MPYYNLLLVNTLSKYEVSLFLILVLLVFSFMFYFLARKVFPLLLTDTMSPAFGVMGTSFGFLLGFTIAILWQNYSATLKATLEESTGINIIINNIPAFQPQDQINIANGLENYITTLKEKEWPAMRENKRVRESWSAFNRLYDIMRSVHTSGEIQYRAYRDILKQLDNVAVARSARIQGQDPMLGIGIRMVLVIGAFFIIFSVAVNDTTNRINHLITVVVVCGLLGFNVGVAFLLAYPFAGSIGIKGTSLLVDIPIRLENLKTKLNNKTGT